MRRRFHRLIPLLLLLAVFAPACQDDIEDEDLSDNFPNIVTFDPLMGSSDVTDFLVEDDPSTAINEFEAAVRADIVTVTINGNQRNEFAVSFASDVILSSYTVQYTPLDAGVLDAQLPPDWSAAINQEVPAGSAVSFVIEIVRLQDKTPFTAVPGVLSDLDCTFGVGANCGEIRRAVATVTFAGQDISGHPVVVSGSLTIIFSDFADEEGADVGLL
jgi:hypothetical protein